jgi:hypothetical protein
MIVEDRRLRINYWIA